MTSIIHIVKKDGSRDLLDCKKLCLRLGRLCQSLDMNYVKLEVVAQKVVDGAYDGITSAEVDGLAAEIAASLSTKHPDYGLLAARICVTNLHEKTAEKFDHVVQQLHDWVDPGTGVRRRLVSDHLASVVHTHCDDLNSAIVHDRDFQYTYFAYKTLEKSYLLRINGLVVERPQHMLMRVALGIHGNDVQQAIETYNLMSEKWFTFSSAVLFNAGTCRPQLISSFCLPLDTSDLEGVCETLKKCALLAKNGSSIGLHVHKFGCSSSSEVTDSKGEATIEGLVSMLQMFNNASRHVTQGGNKRPGNFAIYLEPWHVGVLEFLNMKKNTGDEKRKARDLFYALWIPDLFMKRVHDDSHWCLMDPQLCPGLDDVWGEEFEKLYESYETSGNYCQKIQARRVWTAILDAQIETGSPFMFYKDSCNAKSNQKNLGTITGSNLCTEIVEFSSNDEVCSANVASIALPKFVDPVAKTFDFEKLHYVAKFLTRSLDKLIDASFYPLPEAENSNKRHRPLGVGVQGLADAFLLMRMPFDSSQAAKLNSEIFETIYHGALEASCELAREYGSPYETYRGSPASLGLLQFDMWQNSGDGKYEMRCDWENLRRDISRYGLRNSLLTALIPTSTMAHVLGNNESIEPYTSNVYARRVWSGEFQVINRHLIKDLIEIGVWDESMKNDILAHNGSVQKIGRVPENLKQLYKTVWEIKQKVVIDMATDRGVFIDQSQSLNIHLAQPNHATLTSVHFYAWKKGLKTGMYYLRTKPAAQAIQFTVEKRVSSEESVDFGAQKQDIDF